MSRFVDLSHDFYDGMPGFIGKDPAGNRKQFTAEIKPFVSHEQSAPFYDYKASFLTTEITFQTSIGTYMDSPRVRYEEGRDVAAIRLEELILPGVVVDQRGRMPHQPIYPSDVSLPGFLAGHAVLFNFGWDAHFGTDHYQAYPYLHNDLLDLLIDRNVKIVGVDTGNVDHGKDLRRPAHSKLLARDILIVENLRNLDALHGTGEFRFYCLPIKARGAGAMPARVFAELAGEPA